jgi:hypothetical protein
MAANSERMKVCKQLETSAAKSSAIGSSCSISTPLMHDVIAGKQASVSMYEVASMARPEFQRP